MKNKVKLITFTTSSYLINPLGSGLILRRGIYKMWCLLFRKYLSGWTILSFSKSFTSSITLSSNSRVCRAEHLTWHHTHNIAGHMTSIQSDITPVWDSQPFHFLFLMMGFSHHQEKVGLVSSLAYTKCVKRCLQCLSLISSIFQWIVTCSHTQSCLSSLS